MEIDGFLGAVLEPSSDGYETTRQIWNGDIQRRPAVIARCTGAADVLAAVCFGRERDLPVYVRGGGHAVAGHALCEGGLVIDLSPMTGVRVDPLAGSVRAQGGCLWRHVDHETQAFGLAVTGGIVTHTGIGGLTLRDRPPHASLQAHHRQPGVLRRGHGRGRVLVASADEHPDLFWGEAVLSACHYASSAFCLAGGDDLAVMSWEYAGARFRARSPRTHILARAPWADTSAQLPSMRSSRYPWEKTSPWAGV